MKFVKAMIASIIFVCASANAAQNIEVAWGFNLSGITANHIRFLVDEANRLQSDYRFIFLPKPGAGGAISTNYASNANAPTILAISVSYFIRPNLFTNNPYDMTAFKPLAGICTTPPVVYSKNYKSFKEIPLDAKINIAVTGLGANTHLTALEIQKKYKNANIIPYQGSIQAIIDAAAGRLDMGVAFIGDVRQHIESGTLNSIGVGGNKAVFNTPTLKSQGIDGAEGIMQSFFLLSNSHVTNEMSEKFKEIFAKAKQGTQVQNNFNVDFCTEFDVSDTWYKQQQQYWKSITKDVKVTE
jgi:tripartite-type tricarboxylate transporter receptor subunit TctC